VRSTKTVNSFFITSNNYSIIPRDSRTGRSADQMVQSNTKYFIDISRRVAHNVRSNRLTDRLHLITRYDIDRRDKSIIYVRRHKRFVFQFGDWPL